MKIGGTEAANTAITRIKTPDVTTSNARAEKREIKDIKFDTLNARNFETLSEFEKRELPISEKVVVEAIERANKAISGGNRKFEFSIHEKTKEIMVKVIDSDTNEVIREIPPEKILDMVAKMWEMAGIMVDERR